MFGQPIAKCSNGGSCPKRETCARWTMKPEPNQIYAAFYVGIAECPVYVAMEGERNETQP